VLHDLIQSDLLRAAGAAATSLVVVSALVPRLIAAARRRDFADREGKSDSATLEAMHQAKRKTPIVGGIAMLAGVTTSSLAFADWTSSELWILLGTLLGLGALGFVDDWTKTFGQAKNRGLTPRQKLAGQMGLGLGVGIVLLALASWGGAATALTTIALPFGLGAVGIGALGYLALTTFLVTGTSNAVNLTDGLDGLAGGCGLVALTVYMALAGLSADAATAASWGLAHTPAAAEVMVFLAAQVGALTGFLIFNRNPAKTFMGDAGSLPLGGTLAVAALLTHQELLLALVGGVFVVEALSVMAQVGSFKLTGKRVLACAPLHHHFEFKGHGERRIVSGFHAAALLLGAASLLGQGLGA
jgi:phospho-N-acetylmuramoyl-pentapeptide-transferase